MVGLLPFSWPWRKGATRKSLGSRDPMLRYQITGIAGCCARALPSDARQVPRDLFASDPWPRYERRAATSAMGIRDRPISPRSPWQNGYSERLIGSIRQDCLDHVIVFGERHLRHLLNSYQKYYNEARTHLSLQKDAPIPRAAQTVGRTLAMPVLGGLHHQYFRA
jgi:Integrase core domain